MKEYYTYAYLREDGTPYYIGKGKGSRINRKRSFELPPLERRIYLKQNLTEEEALLHERYIIHIIGKENLINQTSGGQGISGLTHTPETKEKCRQAALNQPKKSPETISKWRETKKKNNKKRIYKPLSEETKEKIRQAHLGKKHSPDTIAKMRNNAIKNNYVSHLIDKNKRRTKYT